VLRKYKINTKTDGWAIVVIDDEIGFFSVVSDWGNYAYLWSAPGCEFRKFLIGCDHHYVWTKINHMRRQTEVWDDEKVTNNVRKELDRLVEEGHITKGHADNAFDEFESSSIESAEGILVWLEEVGGLSEFNYMEGIIEMRPEHNSWGFVTKLLPHIKKALQDELDAEAKAAAAT
jgi:hypothetical protein